MSIKWFQQELPDNHSVRAIAVYKDGDEWTHDPLVIVHWKHSYTSEFQFDITPADARTLAQNLIRAADYSEGMPEEVPA